MGLVSRVYQSDHTSTRRQFAGCASNQYRVSINLPEAAAAAALEEVYLIWLLLFRAYDFRSSREKVFSFVSLVCGKPQ